jgi:FAD/FMN-containing dehydrogenase/Fe-S oxidoreductase
MSSPADSSLFTELGKQIDGDVHHDELNRMLYAADASIYQHLPLAVIKPKHRNDCINLVRFAAKHNLPLIPRAAGTSLAGQVVGSGVVVDTSRYMNNIVEINIDNKTARVQPGVVLSILNRQIRKFGLQFAPDPSTANRCTISGMIGNNAWGAHCPLHGTTRDHVIAMDHVLSDGSHAAFNAIPAAELDSHTSGSSLQNSILRFLKTAVDQHREEILKAFPAPNVVPCNMGYPFHALANGQPWNPQGSLFNPAQFMCGTEGTLSLLTEATLNLVPVAKFRHMVCCHFMSLDQALHAIAVAVSFKPGAVELLDDYILSLTRTNLEQRRNRKWINGDPQAVLLVEFCGDNAAELADQADNLIQQLTGSDLGYHFTQLINEQTDQAWSIRRAGLGLLMGTQGDEKPVTFIEDSAVAVNKLPEFVSQFKSILAAQDTSSVFYGSVSTGLIHLRPILNLKLHRDKEKLVTIADETSQLIKSMGGTMSAKHGDGRIRSHYIRQLLGDNIYSLFQQTKQQFDPANIFNPHKIVDAEPIDHDLRTDMVVPVTRDNTYLDWRASNGVISAIEKCNGAGACRKSAGDGLMCPSYMVTLEEQHSTRGRANVIRQTVQQYGFGQGIVHPNVRDVLNLCLSCKGCRSECPANVDMARIKIEYLQQWIKNHGTPLRAHVIRLFESLSKMGSKVPGIANLIQNSHFFKSLLGYDTRRRMPPLQSPILSEWFAQHTTHENSGKLGRVILLNNAFCEYYDVKVGVAAVEFLEYCGYQVELSPCFSSLRTVLSQGLVETARARLLPLIDYLYPNAENKIPIIGLEPSELLVLRDDAEALVTEEQASQLETIQLCTSLFDEFISLERYKIESHNLDWKAKHTTILLHGHCHQKSLAGLKSCRDALSIIPDCGIEMIPSGCCGMAGSFGYEKEHYALSLQVANLILLPAIRSASKDTTIVATGTSCRQQIRENTDVEPLHPAEVLRNALVL